MKIFGGLKLHPNGFLGAPLEYQKAQLDKPIQVDLIGTATRRITLESDANVVTANKVIDDLYQETLKHESIMRDSIAFRERLFMAGLSAFGTFTIQDWVERQKQNPYFDTMQNRFVEETVGYVFSDFRKYHPMVYLDTLEIGKRNAFSIGPEVRKNLFSSYSDRKMPIRDFIQTWVSKRDGMSDFLISLRILFGS